MTAFHLSFADLEAYAADHVPTALQASVEAHLMACPACRAELRTTTAELPAMGHLDASWDHIRTAVEDGAAGRFGHALRRLGVREPDTVVVRAVSGAAIQWTVAAVLLVFTAALAAAVGGDDVARVPFLVLAPLWPPLGVAASFRFGAAATAPFETTSPYPPARLLLWRTAYVVVTALPATLAFGALIAPDRWMTVTWLLPALACTLVVVVAATWVDPLVPALVTAGGWASVVLLWHAADSGPLTSTPPAVQIACLAVAAVAAVVLDRRLRVLGTTIPNLREEHR